MRTERQAGLEADFLALPSLSLGTTQQAFSFYGADAGQVQSSSMQPFTRNIWPTFLT